MLTAMTRGVYNARTNDGEPRGDCRKRITETFAAVVHDCLLAAYRQRLVADYEFPYQKDGRAHEAFSVPKLLQ